MPDPLLLPLEACKDPELVGGKAAGLGRLLRARFQVPPGVCVTTAAYRQAWTMLGLDPETQWNAARLASESARAELLEEWRHRLAGLSIELPERWQLDTTLAEIERRAQTNRDTLWAVRSSASDEDARAGTFAGIYRTRLGVPRAHIMSAIVDCWVSVWTPASMAYRARMDSAQAVPAMAVIVQPLLFPRAAGVAYSHHPLTGRPDVVAVNSVIGLADPLVTGRAAPDSFAVKMGLRSRRGTIIERHMTVKTSARVPGHDGLIDQPVAPADQGAPSLTDEEIVSLAHLTRRVQRAFGYAVDIEWAIDARHVWLLQARPIPAGSSPAVPLSMDSCVWSRANFKETLPDLPSPLGLSLLERFMEANIVRHYLGLGCRMPGGLPSLRIIRGRPYINVTLLQSFMFQLAGDPAIVLEQMGGEGAAGPANVPRLAWWRLLRAAVRMELKIRRAARHAPAWFAEMKQMGQEHADASLASLGPADLLAGMERLGERLSGRDVTFAVAGGVSQGFLILNRLLERRVGAEGRSLLNAALQGLGQVISAGQILWLAELAEQVAQEPAAHQFFSADPWEPGAFRVRLAGTRFLQAFDAYMSEYGHRAIGESDLMAPRFAETPDYMLHAIRGHVLAPRSHSAAAIRRAQESSRGEALRRIRSALGPRWHERAVFRWAYGRLRRFLALREANRHFMMHVSSAARRLALALGQRLQSAGVLESADDIFYLTADEMREIVVGKRQDAKALVAARRADRAENAAHAAPDTVIGSNSPSTTVGRHEGRIWSGIPVSTGYAEGPVRVVMSADDMRRVERGEILVAAVIDPGMAPVFGLAAGLVVEMGGTLSHGAIMAREYGLPAVVNVPGVTRECKSGERLAVDAWTGTIRRLDS